MDNPVTENTTIEAVVDDKPCIITVRKLRWKDVNQVSNDIISILAAMQTKTDINMIQALDKILKLVVKIKSNDNQDISVDELSIDTLGVVCDRIYELNFTSCRSFWEPLIGKIRNLVNEIQKPA